MSFTTVGSLLAANLKDNPDKEALVFRDVRLTYRELGEKVDRTAEAFAGLGIGKRDKIALDLPNWPEFVLSYFAALRIGAIVVMVNTRYRSTEVKHILKDSDAVAVILPVEFDGFQYLPMMKEIRSELPDLRHVIAVGEPATTDALSFTKLLQDASGDPVPEADINPVEDMAIIMYTSGTTGSPKGAMVTHFNMTANTEATSEPFELTSNDVFLVLVPASHIIGLYCLNSVFYAHGKVVLVDVFKTEPVLQIIEREKVTVQHAVPTVFALELANAEKYDISSLRTGLMAGAACPAELVRRLIDIGFQVHIGYGMTETTGGVTNTRFGDDIVARTETVGLPLRGVEMKFVDEDRVDVPPGQVGEVAVRGQGLMKGYYRQPDATEMAMDRDGWFYTGDLGVLDERKYVRIVGRKKDMIIRGGFNVYPREIEDLLYTNPKVLEAAVIGIPDNVLGERVCACVRPQPGAQVTETEIKEFCKGKIADFKVPDYVRFVEAFPLTPTGKIYKIKLREDAVQEMGRPYEG